TYGVAGNPANGIDLHYTGPAGNNGSGGRTVIASVSPFGSLTGLSDINTEGYGPGFQAGTITLIGRSAVTTNGLDAQGMQNAAGNNIQFVIRPNTMMTLTGDLSVRSTTDGQPNHTGAGAAGSVYTSSQNIRARSVVLGSGNQAVLG